MADNFKEAVLSDSQILAAVGSGKIVCRPFDKSCINPASLNISLGQHYYEVGQTTVNKVYNPFDVDQSKEYFKGPFSFQKHSDYLKDSKRQAFKNIPLDWPIIVLGPGQRILAHSHEFVGIKAPGATMIKARSTWGRNGLAVCFDAGWGDPGYINRWTLEIYNLNQNHSIVLPLYEKIAQLIFLKTGPVAIDYQQGGGKYQSAGEDIEATIANWRPETMLPQGYKDQRQVVKPPAGLFPPDKK